MMEGVGSVMKRFFKATACICLLLMFSLLLAGCINIEMKVSNNGSCDLKYEINTQGMVSLAEVKKQLESGIDEANSSAGKKVAKLKGVREKDGKIIANISLSNISYMSSDAYFGKYSDFEKKFPEYLEGLYDAKTGDQVSREKIKGAGGLNAIKIAGINTGGGDLTSFRLILPGKVKYFTSNVKMIDDKTVTVGGGYGVVLYQRGGGAGWLVIVLVIAAAAAVVFVLAGSRKKGSSSVSSAADPATAPAHAGATVTAATADTEEAAAPSATAVSESSDVVYCPHCGSQQNSGAKFCAKCGGKLSE